MTPVTVVQPAGARRPPALTKPTSALLISYRESLLACTMAGRSHAMTMTARQDLLSNHPLY